MDGRPAPHDPPLSAIPVAVPTATLASVDAAWFAPPVVLLAGAAAAAWLARRVDTALHEVRSSQRRLRRVEDSLIPVRVETRRASRSLDRFDRR